MVKYVDPPSGYLYGFPKPFTFPGSILMPGAREKALRKWFIENGYPEGNVELALKYSRYWENKKKDIRFEDKS